MRLEPAPTCRNRHCDAPTELDKAGQCDTCGCYHREFDTMLYTPWRDERARKAGEERREQIELLRGGLCRLVEGLGARWRGCEFGKAHVGEMFLRALESLGCDRRAELDLACGSTRS